MCTATIVNRLSLILALMAISCSASNPEHHLVKKLLKNYPDFGQRVRPVVHVTDNVTVNMGLSLISFRLHTDKHILHSDVWLHMSWKDSNLMWNPAQHDGVQQIRLLATDIWTPDVTLYNMVGSWRAQSEAKLIVFHTGVIMWVPSYALRSYCPASKASPDYQSCDLKFGTWTYSGDAVDLQLTADSADTSSSFRVDDQWTLVSAPAKRHELHYACCPEAYIDVTFTLKLKHA